MRNENLNDPLLQCLVTLTHYYERPFPAHTLIAGLPLVSGEKLSPSLLIKAAQRAGFIAKITKRKLSAISQLVLPAILILKNKTACILYKIHDDQTVDVSFADAKNSDIQRKSLSELENLYAGYAIFLQPIHPLTEEDADKVPAPSKEWFWGTLWRHRHSYMNVFFASFLINIFAILTPLFVMNVYDRVVPNNATLTLWVLAIGILVVYIFDFVLRTLRHYVIDVVGKKADITLSNYLFQKVLGLHLMNKPSSVGGFVNQVREFEVIRDFFTSATLTTLVDLPFVALYLVFIAYVGGVLVFVPLVIIPIMILITLLVDAPLRRTVIELVKQNAQKNAVLVETIAGLETVKGLVAENIAQKKWEQVMGSASRLSLKSRFYSTLVLNVSIIAQQVSTATGVIVGVYLIMESKLTLGGLIACTILIGRALAPFTQVANLLTRYQQARTALQNLNKLISLPEERPIGKHFLQKKHYEGAIEFRNVSFQYPGQSTNALDHVSFKINAGEHVGILGQTGSGKTTLQKLLLRFYEPTEGRIFIDGIDISQLDPVDLRRHMGYVPQEHILFSGTLRENILMGGVLVTDEDVINAAKISGVDVMASQHPSGYNMRLGERGEGLSGGQKQSVVIARALLSNPPIFLMDEPTSMTDAKTEEELLKKLSTFLIDKTFLVITHRTSPLRLVSRIIFIHQGKIILDGPRNEVLSKISNASQKKE